MRRTTIARTVAGGCGAGLLMIGMIGPGGCASDEPVGHTETTTKRTVDTPTQKTTITETHKKDTTLTPR